MSHLLNKPARKQAADTSSSKKFVAETSGEYNIWYNKYTGGDWRNRPREPPQGAIRNAIVAEQKQDQVPSFACTSPEEFARRERNAGIPFPGEKVDRTYDCFGRERHRDERDDMGGVGSFEKENRTLYVGNIHVGPRMEATVMRHFAVWGEVENVRVLTLKGVAFVRYKQRENAEFAKEAMYGQSLDNNEVLNVRWATEDPNPRAKEANRNATEEILFQKLQEQLPVIGEQGNILAYQADEEYGEYPSAKRLRTGEMPAYDVSAYYDPNQQQWYDYSQYGTDYSQYAAQYDQHQQYSEYSAADYAAYYQSSTTPIQESSSSSSSSNPSDKRPPPPPPRPKHKTTATAGLGTPPPPPPKPVYKGTASSMEHQGLKGAAITDKRPPPPPPVTKSQTSAGKRPPPPPPILKRKTMAGAQPEQSEQPPRPDPILSSQTLGFVTSVMPKPKPAVKPKNNAPAVQVAEAGLGNLAGYGSSDEEAEADEGFQS
ncbi:Pre-mRNA-splicing factor [Quaeritorhiza haematococci]|nr:Pre-mRNA-splicing factor [Quaeritorhiza haematococci]